MQPAQDSEEVVYEVNLEADAVIAAPFDTWLRDHIADMLQFDGFRSAEILDDAAAPPGRIRRVVQYRLRNQAALDDYLAKHAPRMRAQGVARFGGRFNAERRVLPHREEFVRGAVSTENCLNCGEVLTGQHCSHCGQHATVRVLSLWGLIRDVIGDLLDADSRIWRTLWPLAFRPGLLTQDYLRGRRARYTPPFRMYLVLSLAFFVLASFSDPGGEIDVTVDGEGGGIQLGPRDGPPAADSPTPSSGATPAAPASQPPLDPATQRLVDEVVKRVPQEARGELRRDLEATLASATPEERAAALKLAADPCGTESLKFDVGGPIKRYEPRLRDACRRIVADQQSYGRALWDNVPKMMFIFLPLIAAVMALLYLRSGRYYVEHLLFVVHFHAFFFLAGIVLLLLERLSEAASGGLATGIGVAEGALGAALTLYVPWYLLRAMRRVYDQSWWKTLPKFGLLGLAYFISLVFTALGLLFYTALTL